MNKYWKNSRPYFKAYHFYQNSTTKAKGKSTHELKRPKLRAAGAKVKNKGLTPFLKKKGCPFWAAFHHAAKRT
ncbi:MAG: hypothetical protein ACPLYX_06940 [Rectinema subterraneum]|uniref:hypothetical protein n=1 Tax=Rectinema subterraneum TaxID=2653714 RepID=UPI003C7ADBA8